MNSLQKVLIVGASMGLGKQLAAMFPEPKPIHELTASDTKRIEAAKAKRDRKAKRNGGDV